MTSPVASLQPLFESKRRQRARVGHIRFVGGEQTFQEAKLKDALGIASGDGFSAEKMEEARSAVRDMFADLGFLNTRVEVTTSYMGSSNSVDLAVSVEPGPFTFVQTLGYDISSKKLRELVPVFEEGSVDPDLTEEGRTRIVEHMRQLGYFEATVVFQVIEAHLNDAVQINYIVVPGERHRIRDIRFEAPVPRRCGHHSDGCVEVQGRIETQLAGSRSESALIYFWWVPKISRLHASRFPSRSPEISA